MQALITHQNTAAGGASTTAYAQRPLSAIIYQLNPDGTAAAFATLAANQFTLAAGTYRITARAKATGALADFVGIHLYNITTAAIVANTEDGQQVLVASKNVTLTLDCAFTLAGATVFELRGKGSAANANGFGATAGGLSVTYASITITKTA